MNATEQFTNAIKGLAFESPQLLNLKFHVVGIKNNQIEIEVVGKRIKKDESGFGPVQTISFSKWKEQATFESLTNDFKKGFYTICPKESLSQFFKI